MKIAICTPLHGDTRGEFTTSLVQMVAATYEQWPHVSDPVQIRYLTVSGSNLPGNRERLLDMAIEMDADWLLWVDSDQTFPRDALLALMAAGQSLVGTNYAARTGDHQPVARLIGEDGKHIPVWTTQEKAKQKLLEEVSYTGFGLMLMSVGVLRPLRPLFTNESGYGASNEDAVACHKLRMAGHKIFVHHPLSWQVGHVGTRVYWNADSVAIKNRREMAAQMSERAATRGNS